MEHYQELMLKVTYLTDEDAAGKTTKASNARKRKYINEIQKLAVEAKRDLIKQDKGGK